MEHSKNDKYNEPDRISPELNKLIDIDNNIFQLKYIIFFLQLYC